MASVFRFQRCHRMPQHISTESVAANERAAYWNYLVSSVLGRLDTIPQQQMPFEGTITFGHLASLPVAEVASSQVRVLRAEHFIANPAEDFYKINFHLEGRGILRQQNRCAELVPGQWVIYDNTRPYELKFESDYRQLLFLAPRELLLKRLPSIEHYLALSLSAQEGAGRVLFEFLRSALSQIDHISPDVNERYGEILIDLLVAAFSESSGLEPAEPFQDSTRLIQVKRYIADHLHEHELSVESIARALHLSKRHLHTLFVDEETTLNRYIWQQRIERSAATLRNPKMNHLSISEVSTMWGFRSSAHFSRLFKSSTGETPRVHRLG